MLILQGYLQDDFMSDEIMFYWFDMDHTLINNDCDVSWKEYVVKHALGPADSMKKADEFFEQYNRGTLDHEAFLKFQLLEFVGQTESTMQTHARAHFEEFVRDKVYADAKNYIAQLRAEGKKTGILTATNTILAQPLAEYMEVDFLLGTTLEQRNGVYTGGYLPPFGGGKGKVEIITGFAEHAGVMLADIAYFGDSINDRFILEAVGHPFAVNPSPALDALAEQRGWTKIKFA